MKNTVLKKIRFDRVKQPLPISDKLCRLRIKDYSLIGLRETHLENETQSTFHDLLETRPAPKYFSIISQNREILYSENLSTPQRIFTNFESFKWSELYFNFFKSIATAETNQLIYSDVLFQLESHLAQYKTAIYKIQNRVTESNDLMTLDPVQRWRAQIVLLNWILNSHSTEALTLIYLYDLILIAINKENFSLLKNFVIAGEAKLLLNHFVEKKLISVSHEKIHIEKNKSIEALKEYCTHQGRFAIAAESAPTVNLALTAFKNNFTEIESELQKKAFDSCFFHV